MRKVLVGFAPLLAMGALVTAPPPTSAAGESQCRVLTFGTASQGFGKTCNNPPGVTAPQNIRDTEDGAATTPVSSGFGGTLIYVNPVMVRLCLPYSLRRCIKISPHRGHAGAYIRTNPESSATACRVATGSIPWVDITDASPSAAFAGAGAWLFTVESNSTACSETERGKVRIRSVSLLFETLGAGNTPVVVTGTLVGRYEQPGANCTAGGIRLELKQPGITSEPEAEAGGTEVDDGEEGGNTYLCVVGANNYVYPSEAPKWSLTEKEGIWKD